MLTTNTVEQSCDHWAIRYPTHVDDVARAVRQLAALLEQGKPLPARLHFSGGEALTKYEMARIIAEACKLSSGHLKPDPNPPAGAPRHANPSPKPSTTSSNRI